MRSLARSLAITTTLALALSGAVVSQPAPASAAGTADDLATLDALLESSQDVSLSGDIAGTDTTLGLAINGSSTLDLAGHDLTVIGSQYNPGIEVPIGAHLIIKDSVGGGTLTSTGGLLNAGIGSKSEIPEDSTNPGLLEIQSGTVIARASQHAAGLGGSRWRSGPAVKISGGTVVATGGIYAAGIGAGYHAVSSPVEISGGDVTASALDYGAAIGGSYLGGNSTTTISGGKVTLHSSTTVLGSIDEGVAFPERSYGTVAITGGEVTIAKDSTLLIYKTNTVVNSGKLVNDGRIAGRGVLDNQGTIIGSGTATATIAGRNYVVTYWPLGGRAYDGPAVLRSGTLASIGVQLPVPTHNSLPFTGWNTRSDGTGTFIDDNTDFPTVFGGVTPQLYPNGTSDSADIGLYAMYGQKPVFTGPSVLPDGARDSPYSFALSVSGSSRVSYTLWRGGVSGLTLNETTGVISGTPDMTGSFEFTVLASTEGGSAMRTFRMEVQRWATTLLAWTYDELAVTGSTIPVRIRGLEQYEPYTVTRGTTVLGKGIADTNGDATARVRVPSLGEGRHAIRITGSTADRTGTTTLRIIAAKKKLTVKAVAKRVKRGSEIVIVVKNLAPGESVWIRFRGKWVVKGGVSASKDGTYWTTAPVGSATGTKSITAHGESAGRAGSAKVIVRK